MTNLLGCKYKVQRHLADQHSCFEGIYIVKCEGCGHECFGEVTAQYEDLPFHVKMQVNIESFMFFYEKEDLYEEFN